MRRLATRSTELFLSYSRSATRYDSGLVSEWLRCLSVTPTCACGTLPYDWRREDTSCVTRRFFARNAAQIQPQPVRDVSDDAAPSTDPPSPTKADSITPVESHASLTQIGSVMNHSALIVTREIEWGTVLLGFEQVFHSANKYTVLDEEGNRVALIAEDITGIGNAVGRQLLRRRRSFTATVFSADGSQVIFKIRRPIYLISSSMFVEDGSGEVLGEIQQRWHLWKRNYDLYLDRAQFAQIEGNFLAWEFELKNEAGGTLALIDRNFQGFGKELLTDAGKYVIHFGERPVEAAASVTNTLKARTNNPSLPPVTPLAKLRTGVKVIPTSSGNQLVVANRLDLTQRMVALACAMTIDFDYFSQHSSGAGYLTPPIMMPLPGGGSEVPATEEPSAAAAASEMPPETSSTADETLLGGDEEAWSPDQSEVLDSGEGIDVGGLFDGLSDFFNGS